MGWYKNNLKCNDCGKFFKEPKVSLQHECVHSGEMAAYTSINNINKCYAVGNMYINGSPVFRCMKCLDNKGCLLYVLIQ